MIQPLTNNDHHTAGQAAPRQPYETNDFTARGWHSRPRMQLRRVRTGAGILILAMLLSVSLLTSSTALAGSNAAPVFQDALSVVNQVVKIDYGSKITITAVVNSGSRSVESVRALFRPRGGSTVWSYYYPEFEINDGHASVTFEISTGAGSYYPPGTEFEIEIELTQTDGDKLFARSPDTIEYLDPDGAWKRMAGDGYTVVYYGVSRSDVADLVAQTNSRIPTLREVLGVEDLPGFPDFKAVVFPSVRDATPSFPPVSQTATDQFLFAGFAQPQYRLFVQGQMNPTTFVHELAHLYTAEAVSSSLQTGLPSWLGEGLARFLETGSSNSSNARLRSSVRPDELLSLRHMGTIPGKRSDVFIFYPQAGAFVGYLVEEYGAKTMADYLAAMNEGQSLLAGFEEIYGQSLYSVENDWRTLFGAVPLVVPSATPEPVRPADDSPAGTTVPLVDYKMSSSSSSNDGSEPRPTVEANTVVPPVPAQQSLIESTRSPATSSDDPNPEAASDARPDYMVAGLVTVLVVVVGAWLYTSRRPKQPKRKT